MTSIRLAGQMMIALLIPFVFACGPGESPALPPVGFKVEFGEHNIPTEMVVGQTLYADVSVRNISSRTWPNKPNRKGLRAVNLSYHWIDKEGRTVVFDGLRTSLPRELTPGEMVRLRAALQAPNQRGRYTLELTMVQEGVAWFPDMEGAKLVVPVAVLANPTDASAPTREEPPGPGNVTRTKNPRPSEPGKVLVEKGNARKSPGQKSHDPPMTAQVEKTTNARGQGILRWSVQVASYPEEKDAQTLAKKLADKGYDTYVVTVQLKGKSWHRVRVGRLATETDAEKLQQTLKTAEGLNRGFVTHLR